MLYVLFLLTVCTDMFGHFFETFYRQLRFGTSAKQSVLQQDI